MVAAGRQCASGSTITPAKYALQSLQMHEEGWGSHLGEHTARGTMVPSRSKLDIELSGTKVVINFGPLRMPRHLVEQYCCHNYRQHNRGCLYEGRGGMKSGPPCALLWGTLTWYSRKQVTVARHIPGG